MNALILVDIQNDFLPGGALAVPEGDAVIAVANNLIPRFALVVATQDWHPANHGSFAANHADTAVGQLIQLHDLPQVLWPVHCVAGTKGAELAEALDGGAIDRVFLKGTNPKIDSYSGFFDNGRRQATGLGEFLKKAEITEVYVLGLATDYCVKATAMDAVKEGFKTYLVTDGCRGVNLVPGDVARAEGEMRAAGITLVTSDALRGGSLK